MHSWWNLLYLCMLCLLKFYESGKVKQGWLAKDTTRHSTTASPIPLILFIYFYENGKIENGGELTNPLAMFIGGKGYQFDGVYFDLEGKIIQIRLSDSTHYKGRRIRKRNLGTALQ